MRTVEALSFFFVVYLRHFSLGFVPLGSARLLSVRKTGIFPRHVSLASPPEIEQDGDVEDGEDTRIPVTLLSGFLGSGKTSLLQHTLMNKEGLRVGVIVNDLAAVNIDAKLIARDGRNVGVDGEGGVGASLEQDVVELQNGCMCCTMADELFTSVAQLLSVNTLRGNPPYDHIVIESSGVSEPRSVRDNWQDAEAMEMALMDQVRLDTLVTVVDSDSFLDAYESRERLLERPDLGQDGEGGPMEGGGNLIVLDGTGQRAVVDLLVEQVECSDVVVLNKVDLIADEDRLLLLNQVARALNPAAAVLECAFGAVPLKDVLGSAKGDGMASFGVVDEHKAAVKAARSLDSPSTVPGLAADGAEPDCQDPTHDHSHGHNHESADCAEPECQDPTHDHSHGHSHQPADCVEQDCQDPTHDHSHGHNHESADCAEPECQDPTHDHSHSHSHAATASATTAETRFGIGNFVYSARRPFHPERLAQIIALLPTSENREKRLAGAQVDENTAAAARGGRGGGGGGGGGGALTTALAGSSASSFGEAGDVSSSGSTKALEVYPSASAARKALSTIVRSKGFLWLAHTASGACFWSHAGSHFEAQLVGRWWATVPRDTWPEWQAASIAEDFCDEDASAASGTTHGDRRQEIVFIGVEMDAARRGAIQSALEWALVTDGEMVQYEENAAVPTSLAAAFPNPIFLRPAMA